MVCLQENASAARLSKKSPHQKGKKVVLAYGDWCFNQMRSRARVVEPVPGGRVTNANYSRHHPIKPSKQQRHMPILWLLRQSTTLAKSRILALAHNWQKCTEM